MKRLIFKWIVYAVNFKKMYDRCHISAYSAGAAFFMLVSAVPLVMFGISVVGLIAPWDTVGIGRLIAQFFTQNVSGYITRIIAEIQNYATVPFVSVTMIFVLAAATRGIRSIGQGIGVIYGCGNRYNILQLAVCSVVYTVVMTVVCILGAVLLIYTQSQQTNADVQHKWDILAAVAVRGILLFVVLTLLAVFAYRIFGGKGTDLTKEYSGAMVTAAGWMIYSFGYSVYIRHFSKYSLLYGSFGAVMLFMLWLYMCMNILLCGALLNRLKNTDKM